MRLVGRERRERPRTARRKRMRLVGRKKRKRPKLVGKKKGNKQLISRRSLQGNNH
jgi:hypothetical protein